MTDYHQIPIRCPVCLEFIKWKKVNFQDPRTGYPDWRLDIRCECGEMTDPVIRRLVKTRCIYQCGQRIRAEQNEVLDEKLGIELHRFIDAQRPEKHQHVLL